jgi:hypothetical protein
MSFDTEILADLDAVLSSGEFSETVRYKTSGGPWVSVSAFVEEGDVIGLEPKGRNDPVYVTVSKTDVSSVTAQRDVVEWGSAEYTVQRIENENAAGWRLYCVR